MSKCVYRKGGSKKYVLEAEYRDVIPFKSPVAIITHYANLDRDGFIVIDEGFEWDGASGPTIDTDDTMDGSLCHDILYRFMREERLSREYRRAADKCIRDMCIFDAVNVINNSDINNFRKQFRIAGVHIRFNIWYLGLRIGGGLSAR